MNKVTFAATTLFFSSSLVNTCQASLIDFETVPGGTPADQLAISTQYQAAYGVTFSLQDGGTPYLEQTGTGDSGQGFWNAYLGTYDTESAGYEGQLGNYFLRFGTTAPSA